MSKQKLETLLRLAIYKAYGEKCFYTNMPLLWADMEIDHIIPESMADDFPRLKDELGLKEDYDINGIENLVPCRHDLNNRKKDLLFSNNGIRFYLELASSHKDRVTKLYKGYQKDYSVNKIVTNLLRYTSKDGVTLFDLQELINKMAMDKFRQNKIRLNVPVEFVNETVDEISTSEDLSDLQNKPLRLFGSDDIGLELINDKGETVIVKTLYEWDKYTTSGFYPYSTLAIKGSAYLTYLEGLLLALLKATKPIHSYISEKTLIDLLPEISSSILWDIDNVFSSTSLGELIKSDDVKVIETSEKRIRISSLGVQITITEQFRADITGNGIENIFCYLWYNSEGGTMGFGDTKVFSKSDESDLLHEVKLV